MKYELNKYYKNSRKDRDSFIEKIHVCGLVDSNWFGLCFMVEYIDKYGDPAFTQVMDSTDIEKEGWSEITREEFYRIEYENTGEENDGM